MTLINIFKIKLKNLIFFLNKIINILGILFLNMIDKFKYLVLYLR